MSTDATAVADKESDAESKMPRWTPEEDRLVKAMYKISKVTVKSIQHAIKDSFGFTRTEASIRQHAGKLGLTRYTVGK